MGADACDPGLEAYIRALIESAPGAAVLQFNRVDFRLPWLRRTFPEAVIIHLYRHPRDQWVSTLWGRDFPRTGSVKDFEQQDSFYLLSWARDLSYHFPFLDPRTADHPYELFYYLWRLSFSFGRHYANASFCYERLCEAPREELARLLTVTQLGPAGINALATIVGKPAGAHRPQYADDVWFAAIESRCDERLQRAALAGLSPPAEQSQSREVA